MKAFIRNPRTGLPALAVFVTLVLSFAVPPFNSVVAAGSSSGAMSSNSSPAFDCDNTFSGGSVKPGDTVKGILSLANGCRFSGTVHVSLNGKGLDKDPDSNGAVSVSVKTNTDGKTAVLDDPVDVSVHEGRNDVIVTGPAFDPNAGASGNATIDAFFDLAAPTQVVTTPTTAVVTPVTVASSSGGSGGGGSLARTGINLFALFLLALVAIGLGTYTMASERSIPLTAGAGVTGASVSMPLFDPPLGGVEQWTLELVVLAAVSYILGPPPGRHARKSGPRGLVPMIRDWLYPDQ